MSSVQKSESTATLRVPVMADDTGKSPPVFYTTSGVVQITGILSGATQSTIGGGVANSGAIISAPYAYLVGQLSSHISGGRILIPFFTMVSGVP